jgi:hypothetical protein
MKNMRMKLAGASAVMMFVLAPATAWVIHLFYCIGNAEWGNLGISVLFFPYGIIRGTGIWIGY